MQMMLIPVEKLYIPFSCSPKMPVHSVHIFLSGIVPVNLGKETQKYELKNFKY